MFFCFFPPSTLFYQCGQLNQIQIRESSRLVRNTFPPKQAPFPLAPPHLLYYTVPPTSSPEAENPVTKSTKPSHYCQISAVIPLKLHSTNRPGKLLRITAECREIYQQWRPAGHVQRTQRVMVLFFHLFLVFIFVFYLLVEKTHYES